MRMSPRPQRSLQGRGHPSTRPMEKLRSSRVRNPRMGGLVQPSKASGAYREYPVSWSWGAILRHARRTSHGGI